MAMACLDLLQDSISEVPNKEARECLINFIQICSALYTAEARDGVSSQNIACMCRARILKIHQKSVYLLEYLLNAPIPNKQNAIKAVLNKLNKLNRISEKLDRKFGKVEYYGGDVETLSEQSQRNSEDLTEQKLPTVKDASFARARVQEIMSGLNGLAHLDQELHEDEVEAWAINRHLSKRLDALKQKASAHPAIEVYTAHNCRSPLASRGRYQEYQLYAAALERVLKKITKVKDTLAKSNRSSLAELEKQLPFLDTLSHTLGRLHVTTLEESSTTAEQREAADSRAYARRLGCPQSLACDNGRERQMAENLTHALASIGSLRRLMDVRVGQVTAVLNKCSGDLGAHPTKSTNGPSYYNAGDSEKVPRPLGQPPRKGCILDVKAFKCMASGEKKCREQLIDCTRLLFSATDDLLQTVRARLSVVKSKTMVDSALCRPFPETSILRLDLIRLLLAQSDEPAVSPPAKTTNVNPRGRKKDPKGARKIETFTGSPQKIVTFSGRKSPRSKSPAKKVTKVTNKRD
ncbi:hypothetical protein EGW08_008574, partial [Elysia chlorotica]